MIEDMGAKNRTILNGKLLEAHNPTELVEGNTFTIGGTEFIIERFHREIKSISESGIHVWHTCKNALIQLCDLHLKENNFEGFLKQLQLLEDSTQKRLGKNVNEMLRDFIKNVKNILSSTGWLPQEWKNEWDRPSKVLIQA
jgi:hypothetical protein